jgi:hypothetical protein
MIFFLLLTVDNMILGSPGPPKFDNDAVSVFVPGILATKSRVHRGS